MTHWTEIVTGDPIVPGVNGWKECPACDGHGSLQRGGSVPPPCAKCCGLGLVQDDSKEGSG